MIKQVRHKKFGIGTIELDKGITLIVRFEHGLEECGRDALVSVGSVYDNLMNGEWQLALPVITRSMALAIRSVNDSWGVFSRSRIALLPHQLWVCRRVLSSWPTRWLVADDVGLGKTIEAGLILWPLLSRGLVRRFLILCPASLVEQWQYRLRTMFDIRTAPYISEADTEKSDFWETHDKVVASLETLRLDNNGRHKRLFEAQPWDLLMIDEAHHINYDEDSGPTLGYKLASRMTGEGKVTSIVFFTGTPHRGKDFGFLALMKLLRQDLFDPQKPFKTQLLHLREAMIRNNKSNVTDLAGNRIFQDPDVMSETYIYSPEEAEFYEMLTEFILTGKAYASTLGASDQRIVILVLIAMQKLASSSIAAIRRALKGRLERIVAQRQKVEEKKKEINDQIDRISREYLDHENLGNSDELSRLEEKLASLVVGVRIMEDEEPRLGELLKAADRVRQETKIKKILSIVDSKFAGRSVVFFTEYKATQSLLMNELIHRFGQGSVTFINGDNCASEILDPSGAYRDLRQIKEEAANQFNSGIVRFLVSTEAGGEGIDLQENCHSLIHVDLPWNPMRLHQRVGRLNRYGQKKKVEVFTLRNPDTVESRIWEKLNMKIENIMAALAQTMDEPEDLFQLVLGMTSPALFREIFSQASEVPEGSLAAWFDQKTVEFGGKDVVSTVRELVGNCDRFDYQKTGKDIPPVDLPDLQAFMESMLTLNHRRPQRNEDGSLSFKTPQEWREQIGVRVSYENIVFDRNLRGKDNATLVLGVGHLAFDQALKQALDESGSITCINRLQLPQPFIVARIFNSVTSPAGSIRNIVVAAENDNKANQWKIHKDWEILRRLNKVIDNMTMVRKPCKIVESLDSITTEVRTALAMIEKAIPSLNTNFQFPSAELLTVLWPGEEAQNTEKDIASNEKLGMTDELN